MIDISGFSCAPRAIVAKAENDSQQKVDLACTDKNPN